MKRSPHSGQPASGRPAGRGKHIGLSERHLAMPLYEQIKTYVTEGIAKGWWKTGEQLPSEHELAGTLGTSRLTVHRAFRELTEAGTLTRVHGVGTFVAAAKPVTTFVKLHNIADEIRQRGDRFTARVHCLTKERATPELAERFEISVKDHLFHSIVVYSANDIPVQLEDRYVLSDFAPDYMGQDFTRQSTTDYLRSVSPATDAALMIEAVMPDAESRQLLRITKSEPCLVLTRLTRVHRTVTTFTRFVHPGSRHRIASHQGQDTDLSRLKL